MLSVLYMSSKSRPSVCHTGGSVKNNWSLDRAIFTVQELHPFSFLRDNFHPEIQTGSSWERVRWGKQAIFYLYASISPKRYEIRPKLLLITNRKSHLRFYSVIKVNDLGWHWTGKQVSVNISQTVRTAVARLPLRQLGFLVYFVPTVSQSISHLLRFSFFLSFFNFL